MARRGRPPADYLPVLEAVLRQWKATGGSFDRALRTVIDAGYADRHNVSVKAARARVRALVRHWPADLLRVRADVIPRRATATERLRHDVERMARVAVFLRAFPHLLSEEMTYRELAQAYAEAEALLRRRKSRPRK